MRFPRTRDILSMIRNKRSDDSGSCWRYWRLTEQPNYGLKYYKYNDEIFVKNTYDIQLALNLVGLSPPCLRLNAEENFYITGHAETVYNTDDSTSYKMRCMEKQVESDLIVELKRIAGIYFEDFHTGNWGIYNNRPVIIDVDEWAYGGKAKKIVERCGAHAQKNALVMPC